MRTRRIALMVALLLALWVEVASADLRTTRLQDRDNLRCARYGQHFNRDGIITGREQAKLDKINCKRFGDIWVSSLYYAAEV